MRNAFLMDIKQFAVHDGPGIRTTFFLKGCSLRCVWCHNPEGIGREAQIAYYSRKCASCGACAEVCPTGASGMRGGAHEFDRALCTACGACVRECPVDAYRLFGREISSDEAVAIAEKDEPFYTSSGGGITVSGGEPLLQADFVEEFFRKLRAKGLGTAVDTCGNVPWESFEKVLPLTDIFLFDVKHIDSARHRELTGAGNELIISNLKRLSASGARIEVRIPLVPGCNDDRATLEGIGALLGSLNIERAKLLPYHSMARSKYAALGMPDTLPNVPSPTDGELKSAATVLAGFGVRAVSGRE